VYSIALPPLREREEDLVLLVEWMLKRFASAMGKKFTAVAPAAMQLLRRHPWPGNVRELQSVVKFALVQATSSVIVPEFLPRILVHAPKASEIREPLPINGEWESLIQMLLAEAPANLYEEWLARTDTILLNHILKITNGNLVHVAKMLGIHRSTIRAKIRALNISLQSFRAQASEMAEENDSQEV
jgi:two-component system nitrogen regulation response regulator GlnG